MPGKDVQHVGLPWPKMLCSYALLLFSCLFVMAVYLGTKGLVHSEDELLEASVLHPLFNTEEHFAPEYWRASMRQKDRLEALTEATHHTAAALRQVGIEAFLESAGLIGWLRHNGSQLPWDSDGDLGILVDECWRSGATKEQREAVHGCPDFMVLKFACTCEEDCSGDNRRMVGRVAHKKTGVCIDLFAYGPVEQERPWQKDPRYAQITWLGSSGMNIFPPFVLIISMAGAVAVLKGGLVLPSILVLSLCELLVLSLRSDWCVLRRLHAALVVLALALVLQDLRGCMEQLLCQLDDFYIHPRRPKSWTLCLLGSCWDF
eukprot:Skav200922  [mRNA]  locus=scaffold2433:192893:196702:+ [translate_table: standard]